MGYIKLYNIFTVCYIPEVGFLSAERKKAETSTGKLDKQQDSLDCSHKFHSLCVFTDQNDSSGWGWMTLK